MGSQFDWQSFLDNPPVNFIFGVGSSLVAAFIIGWFSVWKGAPWSHPNKRKFKPGLNGANELKHLIKLLGDIQHWLSFCDNRLIREIANDLWTVITRIDIARLSYLCTYSQETDEQIWALRMLSQIEDGRAKEAIEAVITSPNTQDIVLIQAKLLLQQIDSHSRIVN